MLKDIAIVTLTVLLFMGVLLWNANRTVSTQTVIPLSTPMVHYIVTDNGMCWVVEDYRHDLEKGTYESLFHSQDISECKQYLDNFIKEQH